MTFDVNVLTNFWTIAGVIASFLVAGIALWLGITSFKQTKDLVKKQRREFICSEIAQWVTDIHNNFAPNMFSGLRDIVDRYAIRVQEKQLDPKICDDLFKQESLSLKHEQYTIHEINIDELIIRSKYMVNISKALNQCFSKQDITLSKQVYIVSVHLVARKKLVCKLYESLGNEKEEEKWRKRGTAHIKHLQRFCDDILNTIGVLLSKDWL